MEGRGHKRAGWTGGATPGQVEGRGHTRAGGGEGQHQGRAEGRGHREGGVVEEGGGDRKCRGGGWRACCHACLGWGMCPHTLGPPCT